MNLALVQGFLKELAVGFKSAKSYPPGHPIMEKVVGIALAALAKLQAELPDFSLFFLEKTVICQDQRIDVSKNIAVLALLDGLTKLEIESLSFQAGVGAPDLRALFQVLGTGRLKLHDQGGAAAMLTGLGAERVQINAVRFGIQSGTPATDTAGPAPMPMAEHELVDAIRNLREMVEHGVSPAAVSGATALLEDLGRMPNEVSAAYREAMARVLERLPVTQRLEVLRTVARNPFVLQLYGLLDEETLTAMVTDWSSRGDKEGIRQLYAGLGDSRFAQIIPRLKQDIPNVYDYLAQVGLLLSSSLDTSVSRDDLLASMAPYYNMLASPNPALRDEGIRSLLDIADRFLEQGRGELARDIHHRVGFALEQEKDNDTLEHAIARAASSYEKCRRSDPELCPAIVEPWTKVLGRPGIPVALKRRIVAFLGESGDQTVLPVLFTFLWETGIYPDVRAAITKFGKAAVPEALSTLRDTEDYSVRMKLMDVLKNIGGEALDALLDHLAAPEWYLRRNIVSVVGEIAGPSVAERLLVMLSDGDERVRMETVKALARMGHGPGLARALADPSLDIKTEALRGLKKIIQADDADMLLPLLKQEGDILHMELLKIFGELKTLTLAPPIVDFLDSLQSRDDRDAQTIKELAVSTLVRINPPDLKEILDRLRLGNDRYLAIVANVAWKRLS